MYKLLFLLVFSVNISSAYKTKTTLNNTIISDSSVFIESQSWFTVSPKLPAGITVNDDGTPINSELLQEGYANAKANTVIKCKDDDLEEKCNAGVFTQMVNELTESVAGSPASKNTEAPPEASKNTCVQDTVDTASECCVDPTTCLGGETLVTVQSVNQQVAMYAPLTTMVAQTLSGKDLSGLCAASGALAGAGATISASAAITCKKEVLNCTSACDQVKKTQCEEYQKAVDKCKTPRFNMSQFNSAVEDITKAINEAEAITTACNAVKMKAEALTENGKSMLQSAAGATVCAKQASINNKKNNTSNTKKSPISKKQNEDIIGESSDVAITQTGNSMIPNSRNATNNGGNVSGVGSGGNEDQSTLSGSKIAIPNTENNLDTNNINNPDNELSSSHSKSKGLSGRSISSQFGNYNGSSKRSSKYYNDDDKHTGLNYQARSGGGFSGYKGARNRKDYYASIGLTKKQIKKFRNKKQTKRKTIFSSKGTHQNIFERVSKQLQSMCYKTLDCN